MVDSPEFSLFFGVRHFRFTISSQKKLLFISIDHTTIQHPCRCTDFHATYKLAPGGHSSLRSESHSGARNNMGTPDGQIKMNLSLL